MIGIPFRARHAHLQELARHIHTDEIVGFFVSDEGGPEFCGGGAGDWGGFEAPVGEEGGFVGFGAEDAGFAAADAVGGVV